MTLYKRFIVKKERRRTGFVGEKEYEKHNHSAFGNMYAATFTPIELDAPMLGAAFTALFLAFAESLTSIFLHEETLIAQSAHFLRIMGLSAAMLGSINMVTSYYQALGKAMNSLLITMMRNVILFIPCVILMNAVFGLNGTISAQPIVGTLLAAICMIMYLRDCLRNNYDRGMDESTD